MKHAYIVFMFLRQTASSPHPKQRARPIRVNVALSICYFGPFIDVLAGGRGDSMGSLFLGRWKGVSLRTNSKRLVVAV